MLNDRKKINDLTTLSVIQLTMLVVLRVAIGWHFLYEGVSKLFTTGWTSAGYLEISKWIFSPVFHWIASNQAILKIVDFMNIWGLIFIGLGLFLGFFTRIAAYSGMFLLLLYYVANPPFIGMDFGVITEGNYLLVDKNFVEICALLVTAIFPSGKQIGLDRLVVWFMSKKVKPEATVPVSGTEDTKPQLTGQALDRREIFKSFATLPFMGVFALEVFRKRKWESYEEKNLSDAVTSATIKTFNFTSMKELKGQIPHAKIKDLELSRIILGGNLIGGWAHSRDLMYVSKLVKAYHSRDKIFETFLIAEKCGINTFLTNPILCKTLNDYWRRDIGKIKFISDSGGKTLAEGIKISVDNGAAACYTHGEMSDNFAKEGKFDEIGKALDLIRQNGLPAGIGGHYFKTIQGCADYGLKPDFWMKTFHHTNYWSAKIVEEKDNIFCREPNEVIEFMKTRTEPFIAFKTLAAGAILPEDGFKFAFENGADFVCVGMYDFQIVDDVNIALDVLEKTKNRQRPWMG